MNYVHGSCLVHVHLCLSLETSWTLPVIPGPASSTTSASNYLCLPHDLTNGSSDNEAPKSEQECNEY